jgi:hypothetical protein
MRTWRIACGAAVLALGLATAAHADEWNKLTYLTFSGPVSMPGVTLPAGTYRFELADPDSSRQVVRVSDKDGARHYGIFLSISDQKVQPASDPVVMFKETASGQPQAIQAWFYPGETSGYEFVYPHDQALKIARASHQSVLAMKESPASSTDEERVASMKRTEVTRIDEHDKPVSTDEQLKDSSTRHPSNTSPQSTTAPSTDPAAAGQSNQQSKPATTTAGTRATTTSGARARATTTEPQSNNARANTADSNRRTVGTSGSMPRTSTSESSSGRRLPRTAGEVPFIELLSGMAFVGGLCVHGLRRRTRR